MLQTGTVIYFSLGGLLQIAATGVWAKVDFLRSRGGDPMPRLWIQENDISATLSEIGFYYRYQARYHNSPPATAAWTRDCEKGPLVIYFRDELAVPDTWTVALPV
jgi:hypothetical protein